MPHSYVDWNISDPAQTVFSFTKDFLLLSHIVVLHKPAAVGGMFAAFAPSTYAATGTSGAGLVTLNGTAPARAAGDLIRIQRVTPATKAGFLVDFQDGSLTATDLDTAALQQLYIAQEVQDGLAGYLGRWAGDQTSWYGELRPLKFLGAGSHAWDAARLVDVWSNVFAAGSLPSPVDVENGSIPAVLNDAWVLAAPSAIAAGLGLGTAATRNIGVAAGQIPTVEDADARFMRGSFNLTELTSPPAARTSLGLGAAALLAPGLAATNLVQLDVNARYPGADGRNISLTSHAVHFGRVDAYAEFSPILPQSSFASATWLPVQVGAIVGSQHNTLPAIVVSTANDTVTLTNGGYRIRVYLVVRNTSATQHIDLEWRLVRDPLGAPVVQYTSPIFALPPSIGASQHSHVTICREIYFNGVGTFQLQARDASSTPGVSEIVDGQIVVEKLT